MRRKQLYVGIVVSIIIVCVIVSALLMKKKEHFRDPSKCFDCEVQSPMMGKERCFDCERRNVLGSGLSYQLGFPPPAARLNVGAS